MRFRTVHDPGVVWVFWGSVGAVFSLLLLWSWWLDRGARRRGATVLRAADMDRTRRQRDRALRQEMAHVTEVGMTPRAQDAARSIWQGKG